MKNKIIYNSIFLLVIVFALTITTMTPLHSDSSVILIANNSVTINDVPANFLKKVYLGKTKKWSDGSKLVPVSLKKGEVHTTFLKTNVRKSLSQFNTYWKKKIFTGKGTPPKSFSTEAELIKFVKSTPGALGYVSSSTNPDGVKKLAIK